MNGSRNSAVATDWSARNSNHVGGDIFRACPDRLWGQPSLLNNGYRVSIRAGVKRPERSTVQSKITRLKYRLLRVEFAAFKRREVSLNSCSSFLGAGVRFMDCLTFWRRNDFFLILAHVYKMWIIQEPNKLELWNKLRFEEDKTESIYHV
jgi:hypothetical protein